MAKKFFYNKVYNTKRTIINLVIIGVCVIGVILCFIFTSSFEGENHNTPEGSLSIKQVATIEVNEEFSNEIFFSQIENVDLDTIKVTYPDNYDVSVPGDYDVELLISGKNYSSTLTIVDTIKPELTVKELTIEENKSYTVEDFVENCTDNSGKKCTLSFADGIDEEGKPLNYTSYKTMGTYSIKIAAKDGSGNQAVQETKLIITKENNQTPTPEPTTCKYGSNAYDTENYLIAIDITSNNCAVSLDLYKSSSMTEELNKLMETETTRIKKDVEALNLNGTFALNRKITAVTNTTGDGIVGYELRMTVTLTVNNNSETIADYKVNSSGKRIFDINKHNIPE